MNQLIYKSLLDIYPYPIIISKYDGEFLFVNTVYAKSMGFDNPENMIGLNMLNFNALDYNPNELLEILKNGGVIDNHEVSGIKKDTGEIWVALFSSRLVTYDGEDAILSTTIDMSAQKQLERAIKEEQEKLKITLNELIDEKTKYLTLFEEAGDAIVLLDTNGVFFDANQMACNLFKTTKNNIIGKSPNVFSPVFQYDKDESEIQAINLINLALVDKPQKFEWQHYDVNGELFDVAISLKKVKLSGNNYIQAILRDITEIKRTEKELHRHRNQLENLVNERTAELASALAELSIRNNQLLEKNEIIQKKNETLKITLKELKETQTQLFQSEKMASLGTLTAGVAHEINNPLNYIMGALVGLEKYFIEHGTADKKKTDILQNSILVGIDRISNIIKGLNQFSRNDEKLDEEFDIHSIIDNCLLMLNNEIKQKSIILKDYTIDKIIIKGNVGKLHQVFINIMSNSLYSITEKGEILIKTILMEEKVVIEISDNGIGIDKEHLSHITDPFFTTKSPGEGIGLGLAIVYSIITDHKGEIEFESEVNKGTKAKLIFPLNK